MYYASDGFTVKNDLLSVSRLIFLLKSFPVSLCLILLLAASLRLWGIQFGLPDLFHADEPIVVNHALQFGTGDFNPHFFNIPPLTSYLLFAIYGLLFVVGKLCGLWGTSAHFAEYFFHDPSLFYLCGRIGIGVVPAVASVCLLMNWMRRLSYSPGWVLVAGLLFAVCFVHVSDAHFIYADMLLVFSCLAFFYALHTLNFLKKRSHLALGFLIGLATAFKYNGFFLIAPYLWMCTQSNNKKSTDAVVLPAIAALGCAGAFILLNPYSVLDHSFFLQELHEQSLANQGVSFFHHLTYSLAEGMSWPLVILSLVGVVRAFFSNDFRLKSVSVYFFIYYLVLWQKGQPYGRYILPLVPFSILLAIDAAQFYSQKNKWFRVISMIVVSCAVAFNLAKDIRFNWVMRSDVRSESLRWIEENIARGSRIALDGTSFSPRLSFSCEQLQSKLVGLKDTQSSSRMRIQTLLRSCGEKPTYHLFYLSRNPGANPFMFGSPEIPFDIEELRRNEIRFVVFVPELHSSEQRDIYRRQLGKLIRFWSPRADRREDDVVFDKQMITGGPFAWSDIWSRVANGYRIELYDLESTLPAAR